VIAVLLIVIASTLFNRLGCTFYKPHFDNIPISIQNTSLKIDTLGSTPMVYLELNIVNNHKKDKPFIAINCYVELRVWYSDTDKTMPIVYSGIAKTSLPGPFEIDDVPVCIVWIHNLQQDTFYDANTNNIEKMECVFYVTWIEFTGKNQWGDENLTSQDSEFIIANTPKFYAPTYIAA